VRSALYTGTLVHARREPKENVFRYPVAYWLLDLDELPQLDRLPLVSVNRPGLVSFRDRDHFDGDGTPVKEAVRRFADDPGIERVLCLTQLRVAGYVFNPVSFFWNYGADGRLRSMIAELNNTFGERLPQLLPGDALAYEHEKRLHVSPFFGLDGRYRYTFSEPGGTLFARIEYEREGRPPFQAVLAGRREELSGRTIARFLARYPLMPLQVTAKIHWQALRLYVKGVPFRRKPPFVPGQGSVRT
jgi:DUF1365 family protein